jgi:hypothetical protein
MLTTETATEQKQQRVLGRLSHSRLRAARGCRRLHFIQYIQGIKPIEKDEVLRFGDVIHKAQEAWWNGWQLPEEERLAVAIAAIKSDDPFEVAKARVMMVAYHLRWKDEPLEVLGVEVPFETDLRNPVTGASSRTWVLAGKIDAIARHRETGLVYLVEHKTSGEDISPGSAYYKRLRMDPQISTYFEGGTSLGYEVAGCIYDVLAKPGQRPLKATPPEKRKYTKEGKLYANLRAFDESPDEYAERVAEVVGQNPAEYFARVEVVRLRDQMHEAMLDTWQLGQELREAELAGRHPKNPDHCVRNNFVCPYFPACSGEASLDDPTRYRRRSDTKP